MPTAFDNLPKASFRQISFPITKVSVKGSLRYHVHEYPHADGGQPEKLGRRLYVIKMQALFYDVFQTYGDLWPEKIGLLAQVFEAGVTQTLVVPTVGSIQAFCTDWPREADFTKIRSGETMDLEFLEDPGDQSSSFTSANAATTASSAIQNAVLMAPDYPTIPTDLLGAIQNGINAVLSLQGQVSMFGQSLANQVDGIMAIFGQFDNTPAASNPANWPIVSAVHDAALQMVKYQQALSEKQGTPMQYTVPYLMSIGEVSTAIFGNTQQAVTLLQTNDLDDALAIPQGTKITYLSGSTIG